MSSAIETIIDNLETQLKKIRESDGYNTTVQVVDRDFVFQEDGEFPALLVMSADAQLSDRPCETADVDEQINIYAYIKDAEDDPTLQTQMLQIRQDIIKLIATYKDDINTAGSGIIIRRAVPAGDVFSAYGYAPGYAPPFACLRVELEVIYNIVQTAGG